MTQPCEGLACKVPRCQGGGDTAVSGVVTAPNGTTPIREALVYVPISGVPEPMVQGVACDVCTRPGRVVTQTLTATDGSFRLPQVPATADTPIVIQKGRWRRVVNVPVSACQDQKLTQEQTRLPRNRAEGSLPQIAVAVGVYDSIECVLKSIGIDAAEFVRPPQDGAVHLYDNGALAGATQVKDLVSDLTRLSNYHIAFFGCAATTYSQGLLAQDAVRKNLSDFAARGGRIYATDHSYDWVQQVPAFSPYICFTDDQPCSVLTPHGFHRAAGKGVETMLTAEVDKTTDAGKALAEWLTKLPRPLNNGVPITEGLGGWAMMEQMAIDQMKHPGNVWLWAQAGGKRRPFTASFDYPSAPERSCGRVLYSSYHTRQRRGDFPAGCPAGVLDQEHVLEYLIFELGACVGFIPE